MEAAIFQEIQGPSRMTVGELRQKCIEVFGEESRSFHKDFLRQCIAWRIQARAEGDLSERAKRRAEELANDTELRVRTPRKTFEPDIVLEKAKTATSQISNARDPRLPIPGTLVRTFTDPVGNKLRYKAVMTGTPLVYPRIHSLGATLS